MRLFIAIQLPQFARTHLRELQDDLRVNVDYASWVKPDSFHLTLKFLGEVAEEKLPEVCNALREIEPTGPRRLMAAELLFLPPNGPARVIAAALAGDTEIISFLAQHVDAICGKVGIQLERRKFRAHVTLARPRYPLRSARQSAMIESCRTRFPGPVFQVERFVLMQSTLRREGSEYTHLANFPL